MGLGKFFKEVFRGVDKATENPVLQAVVPGMKEADAVKDAAKAMKDIKVAPNAEAVLVQLAIETAAQAPEVRNMALKIHHAIQAAYANDPEFAR